ncbi:MAG: type II restriction endonuclease [Planctomycetaceae bacterium]|jgi:type II restriction enzyme|nr:type II restriction endonuclease [Planctomycetaceae bacterium]
MAKKIISYIKSAADLITPHEATRAGFVAMALEKNFLASPFVEQAKILKVLASQASVAKDLLSITELRDGLLTASGLSDKSLNYLSDVDKKNAINNLIECFLEPAGISFVDELVYRFLIVKGDTLGGKTRNLAGALGEQKFLRAMIASFDLAGIAYQWLDSESHTWKLATDAVGIEKRIKALHWRDRLLYLNLKVPLVTKEGKKVDLILLNGDKAETFRGSDSILTHHRRYIALGELKAGIDPAGADEHWKTADMALKRIRASFEGEGLNPHLFFIGAAIEKAMAREIFEQIQNGTLSCAANLTNEEQLAMICQWIIGL